MMLSVIFFVYSAYCFLKFMIQGIAVDIGAKVYDNKGSDEYYKKSNKSLWTFAKSVIAAVLAAFFMCMSF